MIRRISTKWLLTVLAAVLVPFLAFVGFIDTQTTERQWDVVRYYLLSLADDLAARLDRELSERRLDVELVGSSPVSQWVLQRDDLERQMPPVVLGETLDQLVRSTGEFDLIVAIDAQGRYAVSNDLWADQSPFARETLAHLAAYDYAAEPWFQEALALPRDAPRRSVLVDHHRSPLLPQRGLGARPSPLDHHVGVAVPVADYLQVERNVGVIYALISWQAFQAKLSRARRARLAAVEGPDIYSSSYPWLWQRDGDTILAHPQGDLYLEKVSGPRVGLPQLVSASLSSPWGMYPEYSFGGKLKNAAYRHCAGPEQGGLGWIVGYGIDNSDVTSFIDALQNTLLKATLLVLLVVVLITIVIARRTTAPIVVLQQHTQRVAAGDLDTQVEIPSRDELGDLGRAFNTMTRELKDSRARLVQAEKEAAWREMARQVAHEIKNPLTPINLSVTLLKRAKDENSREFDALFERTVEVIARQIEHMRRIAADFSAFAGARRPEPEVVDAGAVLDEVLALNAAWAAECGVEVRRTGGGGRVQVDLNDFRRVLINLVSNALQAMPQGGRLEAGVHTVERAGVRQVVVEVRDTGPGLSETVRARLFEPYFTTRSHGTGLGLAIAARLVDEMNGRIEIQNVPPGDGEGAVARVSLPEHRP